jgi:hypothetical protein
LAEGGATLTLPCRFNIFTVFKRFPGMSGGFQDLTFRSRSVRMRGGKRRIALGLILSALVSSAGALERPDSKARFACRSPTGERYFSLTMVGKCNRVIMESGWVNFALMRNVIVDLHPGSIVREGDTAKLWVEFHLADPVRDDLNRQYDSLRASYRLNCKTREQLLIQGTYRLGAKVIWQRLSDKAVLEEIEPGTINDALLAAVCEQAGSGNRVTELEADFKCPEHLPNEEEREAALKRFIDWVRDHRPEWNTVAKLMHGRTQLLSKHGCTETLRNLSQGQ